MAMSLEVQLSQLRDVTFQKQFLHYHRAGHGAITSPQTQRGYTAFVHTRISRVIGASGIHVASRASADDPLVMVARWQVCRRRLL
jgi:ribulose 1,5-bisphosphate carboxylase large subunit-like protein